ncbi:cupredoxin domain-containing protein [Roseovarius sp. D22-M7]|uniref:cupredoxin domain-containing protein n=1 Tax=Roseovarius sp. D22-M7 TaxID=3127116 RepID=UPI00301029CB
MNIRVPASALILASSAAGSGDHAHGETPVGQSGSATDGDRTIEIRMVETDEGMGHEPSEFSVQEGETLRISVRNAGELEHEIVLGAEQSNLAHKTEMAGMGQMKHDDPNALRLDPGAEGELVWTFSNAGIFQFACLISGHMEAGMHGPITVN